MAAEMMSGKPLKVEVIENATVVGFGEGKARGISRPAAVFGATGKPVALAQCWRDSRTRVTTTPPLPALAPTETLPGTWLFGGMLYAHFGHFLCESTGRLWGLDQAGEKIAGVLFYPKKQVTWERRFLKPALPWLEIAGVTVPVRLALAPLRVERLLVPAQGFGTGDMIQGAPEFHTFVRKHFGVAVAPAGPEKIFISRSRLFSKRGRILGEIALERWLAAEGYSIFHPQDHPIETQIAQYKAARQVISTDCSALHLAAFFAQPQDRVAIIARRPGPTVDDFVTHYGAFSGIKPLVLNTIRSLYTYDGAKLGQMSEVFSEVDFAALHTGLAEAGFVSRSAAWQDPSPAEIKAELTELGEKLGSPIRAMDKNAA